MSTADLHPGQGGLISNRMNTPMKRAAAVLLVALGALLAGCSSDAPVASSIPWNQPADWEGQIPGMTGSGSQVH